MCTSCIVKHTPHCRSHQQPSEHPLPWDHAFMQNNHLRATWHFHELPLLWLPGWVLLSVSHRRIRSPCAVFTVSRDGTGLHANTICWDVFSSKHWPPGPTSPTSNYQRDGTNKFDRSTPPMYDRAFVLLSHDPCQLLISILYQSVSVSSTSNDRKLVTALTLRL